MKELDKKLAEENENKIIYLETKLKSILKTIKYINEGDLKEATSSLNSYKKSSSNIPLTNLVHKVEELSQPKPNPEDKSYVFLKVILNSMPFPVFIKDEVMLK